MKDSLNTTTYVIRKQETIPQGFKQTLSSAKTHTDNQYE